MKKTSSLNDEQLKNDIVKELFFDGSLSCASLSLKVGKSLPLIAKAITDLTDAGLVREIGYAPSNGGRRAVLYSLVNCSKVIVAVAMDQLSTRIAAYNLDKEVAAEAELFTLNISTPDALDNLVSLVSGYIDSKHLSREDILGIGIGMPGFVDVNAGINHSFLPSGKSSLRDYLADAFDLPVLIDNDSSLIALAEFKFGAAQNKRNAMVVNVSWGIGLGIILNGEMFRGHSGFAGEFSHIPVSDNGELCSCGKRGCLETSASLLTVAKRAEQGITDGRITMLSGLIEGSNELTGDIVLEAANKGDQFAIEILRDAGYALGKGFAVLIHILNPELIVLSGRGASVGKLLTTPIQQSLYTYAIPRLAESTGLAISTLGNDAGLLGASALVIEHLGREVRLPQIQASFKVACN